MENKQLGIPRTHPDFIKVRRARFVKLLREAKRILKLSEEEQTTIIKLYKLIKKGTLK
jgi:hypothetical protein